jgi:hypothetical protein
VNAAARPSRSTNNFEAGGDPRTNSEASPHRGPIRLPPLLTRCASDAAERWASRIRSKTLQEKRRTSGGWPGTLSEARSLVAEELLPGLGVECLHELVLVDQEQLARFLYRSARTWWNHLEHSDVEDVG